MKTMNSITLASVLPKVFVGRTDMKSDIWQGRITIEKGNSYLVEAASGTGKSSLCSFIIGYRNDFEGDTHCYNSENFLLHVSQFLFV